LPYSRFPNIDSASLSTTVFTQVEVNSELGTVCWPNDADLDSDVLYAKVTGVPVPEYITARK
jgi:Protein of unknown function (DUF2442)